MRNAFYGMLVLLFLVQGRAAADKIYLKSGEILEGKIKEDRYKDPYSGWCLGKRDTIVWEKSQERCFPKEDIEKVEKEIRKAEGAAQLAKEDGWGENRYGYKTQLIPATEKFIVGKPMRFSLVMRNVGDSLKWFDHQGVTGHSLAITDPDGKEVYYKISSFQTTGSSQPIDAGETVVLLDTRDIASDYLIVKPGKYTIQFREGNYGFLFDDTFPASNVVSFEVEPGNAAKEDRVMASLVEVVPQDGWRVAKGWDRKNAPIGRKASDGFLVLLVRIAELKKDILYVRLWVTRKSTDIAKGQETKGPEASEFLGKNKIGYFYAAIPPEAEKLWPSIREDLVRTLNLKSAI
ncbi:MAG: hypothetical protein ABH845_05725 [Candidatus Omnitrophota bacterium]